MSSAVIEKAPYPVEPLPVFIPSFSGQTNIACEVQLARARGPPQPVAEALAEERACLARLPIEQQKHADDYSGCECRISENGCIDTSKCSGGHLLFPIPLFARWCDVTTSLIEGGGGLVYWSGWARPAAMKLLGRYPTRAQVQHLIARSHRATLHVSSRYQFVPVSVGHVQHPCYDVVTLFRGQGPRGKRALASIPALSRFRKSFVPPSVPPVPSSPTVE